MLRAKQKLLIIYTYKYILPFTIYTTKTTKQHQTKIYTDGETNTEIN